MKAKSNIPDTIKPSLTDKEVHGRLPADLLKKIRAERSGENFKQLTSEAIAYAPEDAARAAVKLVQLCGRIPSDEDVKHIHDLASTTPSPPAA